MNQVGFLGLDGYDANREQGTLFISLPKTAGKQCGCTYVRFKPENADTDQALSIAMLARAANMTVRIDLRVAGDCNSAYRIYLE